MTTTTTARTMKLSEWIEQTRAALLTNGYRKAEFEEASEAAIGRRSTRVSLFTAKPIALDAMVSTIGREELSDGFDEMVPAVRVTFEVLKPRKRKVDREYFYLPLASTV